jgi:hypothetical protein
MGLAALNRASGIGVHVLVASESDTCDQLWDWQRSLHGQRVARVVRGGKCPSAAALYDEFTAAWQFPCYFGENWDALEECLTDLEWLPASEYLLLVSNAERVLAMDSVDQQRIFWELLQHVGRFWAHIRQPPVAFHIVAHTAEPGFQALRRALEAVNISCHALQ